MTQPISAEDIGPGFAPTARTDVVGVEIDGEMVVYDDARGVLHRLNPTAAMLWQCIDGGGTLAEIAADMADVFEVEPDRVLIEILTTARHFGEQGLLVGVGEPFEDRRNGSDKEGEQSGPFVPEELVPCTDCGGTTLAFPNAEILTVKAGPRLLGLQVTSPGLAAAARTVLRPALAEGVDAPAVVSIVEGDVEVGPTRYFCYRGARLIVRTGSIRRALQAAVTLMDSQSPGSEALCHLPALLAVRGDVAALFDQECQRVSERLRPRLQEAGWAVADVDGVDLDPLTSEVVVSVPSIAFDRASLSGASRRPDEGEPPPPGRYRVAACVFGPHEGGAPVHAGRRDDDPGERFAESRWERPGKRAPRHRRPARTGGLGCHAGARRGRHRAGPQRRRRVTVSAAISS